jgi:hypothetical protein
VDLEAAHVLSRRGVGRPAEEGREAPDEADVVALRFLAQAAHGHVVEHASAQRADNGRSV